jgi:ATPase subunit of ABC transporter with duplicated ATPase domains
VKLPNITSISIERSYIKLFESTKLYFPRLSVDVGEKIGISGENGGALLFITHDKSFLENLSTKQWLFKKNKVIQYTIQEVL